jgi:hypothetical protein
MRLSPRLLLAAVVLVTSTASAAALHDAWEGMVMGKDGSKIRGEIEMEKGKAPKTTTASVDYKNDVAGAVRPWHVHVGSCAKPGPVLGDAKAYTPITVGANGAGKATATLTMVMPEDGSYYVNIHESAANMSKIVACGDLLMHE